MGCDIHPYAQKKVDGKWQTLEFRPFRYRDYFMFGLFANVRNSYNITPISLPRGIPEDFEHNMDDEYNELGEHSFSWLSVNELLAVDYDGLRCKRHNEFLSYREILGQSFFNDLMRLQDEGADRIVFGFDS